MNIKNHSLLLLAATMAAVTPTLEASTRGVVREIAINGDNVITVVQDYSGNIIGQVSHDGGVNWSEATVLNQDNPGGILPGVAVGASSAACVYLINNDVTIPPVKLFIPIVVGGTITGPSGPWTTQWPTETIFETVSYDTAQGLNFAGTENDVVLFLTPEFFAAEPSQLDLYNTVPPGPYFQKITNIAINPSIGPMMPALLAANGLTALAIAPQPGEEITGFFPLSQLYQAGASTFSDWTPGASAQIPSLSLSQGNPLLLATSEDLSQASLVWLGGDSHLYTSQLQPITSGQWSTPVQLSPPLNFIGGLNFDETSDTLQVLGSNSSGHIIYATGTPSNGITSATVIDTALTTNQISESQISGATGLWLFLDNNYTLSLLQASPQGLERIRIATNLSAIVDGNISMAVASDEGTGVVLLVFDIAQSIAFFPGHTGLSGPGTYVFRSEGYPLNFTAQQINH